MILHAQDEHQDDSLRPGDTYRKVSNIRRNKFQNLNASRLIL